MKIPNLNINLDNIINKTTNLFDKLWEKNTILLIGIIITIMAITTLIYTIINY